MKIVEDNGFKYSRESFDGYKFRAKVQIEVNNQEHYSNLDIYTTNTSRDNVWDFLLGRQNKIFESCSLGIERTRRIKC